MDREKLCAQKNKKLTPIEDGVEKMLSLVRREGCKESKNKIFRTIGFVKGDMPLFDDEGHALNTDFIKGRALANLERNYIKNQVKNNVSHDDFLKKITDFRDSLKESIELMKDPAIIKILEHNADKHAEEQKLLQRYQQGSNIECNAPKNYPETYRRMSELYEEMGWAVLSNSHKRNRGRASLAPLYDYVYELAVLYEKLSKEKLSIFRYKEGGYEPVTPGHEFIHMAIQLLNREFLKDNSEPLEERYIEIYTDKNIYNACEKAQKRLNHNQQ